MESSSHFSVPLSLLDRVSFCTFIYLNHKVNYSFDSIIYLIPLIWLFRRIYLKVRFFSCKCFYLVNIAFI